MGTGPGQMGDNLRAAAIPADRTVISLVSSAQMVALLDDGSVICWGDTGQGRCASGKTNSATRIEWAGRMQLRPGDDKAVQIAASETATFVLTRNGNIAVSGSNSQGSIGTGVKISYGDDPSEVGAGLLNVDVGTNSTVKAIQMTGPGSCAILSTYELKCWGYGYYAQLGTGSEKITIGDNPGEMGDALVPVDLGNTTLSLCVGIGEQPTCGAGVYEATTSVEVVTTTEEVVIVDTLYTTTPAQEVDWFYKSVSDLVDQVFKLPVWLLVTAGSGILGVVVVCVVCCLRRNRMEDIDTPNADVVTGILSSTKINFYDTYTNPYDDSW